jgi:TatA/E family protein of Tat protein translocase
MNFFGMGPLEILLIVVLALIVFGPARLPEIMGQVGRAIADFRRATSQLSDEFNRTIQAEIAETRAVVDETKSAVTGVHSSINSAISGVSSAATLSATAAAPTPVAPPSNGVPSNGTTTAVATEDKPPLAETAQWSWETAAPAPNTPAVETPAPDPVVTAEAPAAIEEAPKPFVPTVEPPAPRVARSRRSRGRDELLPPY